MKTKIKIQKGFIQVPLLIVLVISTVVIGGVSYGVFGYHKISKVLEESEQLTQKENYNEAIEKLESVKNGWIVKNLRVKKQEISHGIEKNEGLLEDKSEYIRGVEEFDKENWQEAENLLSRISNDSPYYQESKDKIEEIKSKTVEKGIAEAVREATESLTKQGKKAQQKQKELEAKQAELEEEARENKEKAQQKQKELEAKQAELEEAQEKNSKTSHDLTSIIEQWKPMVGYMECEFRYNNHDLYSKQSGTAVVVKFRDVPACFITNRHILIYKEYGAFDAAYSCSVKLPNRSYRYLSESGRGDITVLSSDKDGGFLEPNNPDDHIRDITSPFPKLCEQKPLMGDEIVILGYPGIGSQEDVTVTRGIISGFEDDYYITDAKIDHGNSGGAAILLKNNCLLGLSTYAMVGKVESLGRILGISAFVEF